MKRKATTLMATAISALILSGCGGEQAATPVSGIEPKVYTDSLFAVMNADRTKQPDSPQRRRMFLTAHHRTRPLEVVRRNDVKDQ
jgi:hypothetical protein